MWKPQHIAGMCSATIIIASLLTVLLLQPS
jgi:hypothetical protein